MGYYIDGFIFDLAGIVYLSELVLPSTIKGIAELRRRGKKNVFVSNKPLKSHALRGHSLYIPDKFSDQDSKEAIDPTGIDAVVVACDRTLDYRKLPSCWLVFQTQRC